MKPPDHLSERSNELWRYYVGNTVNSLAEISIFQGALEALDRADEARKIIDGEGLVNITKTTGAVHINPLTKLEKESREHFLKAMKTLNLHFESNLDLSMF